MINSQQIEDNKLMWDTFAHEEGLTVEQSELFKKYSTLLLAWNETINLTTITSEQNVIDYHFRDSLQVSKAIDMKLITHCADIGTGGGFPGIPMAIKYPQLKVTLIEVSAKKIQFLDALIAELDLVNRVSIFDEDWRTFLRTTNEDIQLFCARASVQPEELIRVFKPACVYKKTTVVYWASDTWQSSKYVTPYLSRTITYRIRHKKRHLIVLYNRNI